MTDVQGIVDDLETAEWVFAKTMAHNNPHWYTLRKSWAEDDDFMASLKHVQHHGVPLKWRDGRVYSQFHANGYIYFSAEAIDAYERYQDHEYRLFNRKANPGVVTRYDGYAASYDANYDTDSHTAENETLAECLTPMLAGHVPIVYDVGAGTGLFLDMFPDYPRDRYYAIEPDRAMGDRLLEKHPDANLWRCFADDLRVNMRGTVVLGLFGSPSYVNPRTLRRFTESGATQFHMFYLPSYDPYAHYPDGFVPPPIFGPATPFSGTLFDKYGVWRG